MTQGTLNFSQNARRTSPATSKEAARVNREERLAHAAQILDYVRKCPGQCSAEIAQAIGMERHECSRRLSDLFNHEKVRKGASRMSTVGMNQQVTWYANEERAKK